MMRRRRLLLDAFRVRRGYKQAAAPPQPGAAPARVKNHAGRPPAGKRNRRRGADL